MLLGRNKTELKRIENHHPLEFKRIFFGHLHYNTKKIAANYLLAFFTKQNFYSKLMYWQKKSHYKQLVKLYITAMKGDVTYHYNVMKMCASFTGDDVSWSCWHGWQCTSHLMLYLPQPSIFGLIWISLHFICRRINMTGRVCNFFNADLPRVHNWYIIEMIDKTQWGKL